MFGHQKEKCHTLVVNGNSPIFLSTPFSCIDTCSYDPELFLHWPEIEGEMKGCQAFCGAS